MNAGRGMGYCYLSPEAQQRFTPINAGWRAGRTPMESFFGPDMDLSPTASRFDSSISWMAAIGNEARSESSTTSAPKPSTSATSSCLDAPVDPDRVGGSPSTYRTRTGARS